MGGVVSSCQYVFGCKKALTPAQKARIKYLNRTSSFQLLEASVPVFIAAGISNAAGGIIDAFANGSENINIKIVQFLIYAVTVNLVGKYITYIMLRDEENNSDNETMVFIRKYKFSKLFRHVSAENAGFAWKEFFVILALEYAYVEYTWGAAFATYIVSILFFIGLVYLASFIQQKVFKLDEKMNEKLLCFDAESAALPLAFILTVLLGIGFCELGPCFISEYSYIYSWEEEYEVSEFGTTGYNWWWYFIYATTVSFLVASILACQEDEKEGENEGSGSGDRNEVRGDNADGTVTTGRPQSQRSDAASLDFERGRASEASNYVNSSYFVICANHTTLEALTEMWKGFLGYFCGVAWFIFIMDNVKLGVVIPHLSNLVSSFLGVLLIALLVTHRGPSCLTSMRLKQAEIEKKQKLHDARVANTLNTDNDSDWLTKLGVRLWAFYLRVFYRRKDVMIATMRLVIGWVWEIVVQQIFKLMGATEHDSLSVETFVQCILAFIIILLSLCVHLYIRDWDAKEEIPGDDADQQQQPDIEQLPNTSTNATLNIINTNGNSTSNNVNYDIPAQSAIIRDTDTKSPLTETLM